MLEDDGWLYIEGAAATDWLANHLAKELGAAPADLVPLLDRLPRVYGVLMPTIVVAIRPFV